MTKIADQLNTKLVHQRSDSSEVLRLAHPTQHTNSTSTSTWQMQIELNSPHTKNSDNHQVVFDIVRSVISECVTGVYATASRYSGNCVKLPRELKYIPVLEREGQHPVFLYEFIEALDGHIDYSELVKEFPGLSYTQISSALQFMRRLAQFNTAGIDVDEIEEEAIESNSLFQQQIIKGISSREGMRVLNSQ